MSTESSEVDALRAEALLALREQDRAFARVRTAFERLSESDPAVESAWDGPRIHELMERLGDAVSEAAPELLRVVASLVGRGELMALVERFDKPV